jgi:hypothetical protein
MKKYIFLTTFFIFTLFFYTPAFASDCETQYSGTCKQDAAGACDGARAMLGSSLCPSGQVCCAPISSPATSAGIVPCGGATDPCTLCHLIIGIKNLIEWGKNILIVVTIVAIFISGIIYIVSTGSEKMITKAKELFTASLIGFAVTLGAWLIVNVTILWVANANPQLNIGVTSWNTFSCNTESSALAGSGGVGVTKAECEAWCEQGGGTPEYITQCKQGCTTGANTGAGGNCAGLPTQANINKQCVDASPKLNTLLSCVQGKLGSRVTISSISDGNGGLTCYKDHPMWVQCSASMSSGCCFHARNSLHYAQGGSQAVDFVRSGATNSEISSAITACNGKPLDEGNHVHGGIATGT